MSHSTWRDEAENHWLSEDLSLDYLIRRLHEEVEELVANPSSWEEAADVANLCRLRSNWPTCVAESLPTNFAAMIADRAESR
jgi:hypothetical protein